MSCVLTLALDPAAQTCFEHLRRQHFPAALNRIPAHLTLFHTLPESDATVAHLAAFAEHQPRFDLESGTLRPIGRGVAVFFSSTAASALHRKLSSLFLQHLSAQDKQGFRPHIVVQNKVTPAVARETLAALQQQPIPDSIEAIGLDLWRYLDGPWQHLRRFHFV